MYLILIINNILLSVTASLLLIYAAYLRAGERPPFTIVRLVELFYLDRLWLNGILSLPLSHLPPFPN